MTDPIAEYCGQVRRLQSEVARLTRERDARYSATEIVEVFGEIEGVPLVVEIEKARILR